MRAILAAIFAILLGSFLMKLGNALLSLTVNLTLNDAGVRKEAIGIVTSAFSAGFLLGGFQARRLIGRMGHVRALAGASALATLVSLLFPLVEGPVAWALLRAVYGYASAVTYIVFESWFNERANNETRGRVLSIYATANYFALTLGQLLINTTDLGGSVAFSFCAMLLLLGLIPVVSTRLPQPAMEETQRLSLKELYRHSPLAVVVVTGAGLLSGGLFGMSALFAQDIGLSLLQISLFTGASVFGACLLMWPLGRFSDRFGRRAALAWSLALVVATSVLLAASGWLAFGFPLLLLLSLLMGAHMLTIYHSAVAHAYDRLPREHYVAASSSFQICFSVGSIVGPLLTGSLMEQVGPYSLWFYSAGCALLLLIFVAYRWILRPSVARGAEAPTPRPPREGVAS